MVRIAGSHAVGPGSIPAKPDRNLSTLKSLLEEQSVLSKQGGILMKSNKANKVE